MCVALKYQMKFTWMLLICIITWVCLTTPVKSDSQLTQLAACMAVIDFHVHMYSVVNNLQNPPSHMHQLMRVLNMRNHIRSEVIPRLHNSQTQVLAHMYLMLRDQVFTTFALLTDAPQLQQFAHEIDRMNQSCEHLNTSIEQ